MVYVPLPHIFDGDSYIESGSSISFKIWQNLAAESRNLYHTSYFCTAEVLSRFPAQEIKNGAVCIRVGYSDTVCQFASL